MFVIGILVFSSVILLSQQGPIEVQKQGLKKNYVQEGTVLSPKQLASTLKSYPESSEPYKISNTTGIVGSALLGVSALYLGAGQLYYSIKEIQAINDNDLAAINEYEEKSLRVLVVGAVGVIVSVPFVIISSSSMKKSLNIYNSQFNGSFIDDLQIDFGITQGGIGITATF